MKDCFWWNLSHSRTSLIRPIVTNTVRMTADFICVIHVFVLQCGHTEARARCPGCGTLWWQYIVDTPQDLQVNYMEGNRHNYYIITKVKVCIIGKVFRKFIFGLWIEDHDFHCVVKQVIVIKFSVLEFLLRLLSPISKISACSRYTYIINYDIAN